MAMLGTGCDRIRNRLVKDRRPKKTAKGEKKRRSKSKIICGVFEVVVCSRGTGHKKKQTWSKLPIAAYGGVEE